MAGSVAEKVHAVLDDAFAAANAGSAAGDRVTGYDAYIPGIPTSRYWVLYCSEPNRESSTVDGEPRDAVGHFQVNVAASRPGSDASPAPLTRWLVKGVLNALAGLTVSDVDGLARFTIEQDTRMATWPIAVEVVKDRTTFEQALRFRYLADRI